jgi:hypothetical protein
VSGKGKVGRFLTRPALSTAGGWAQLAVRRQAGTSWLRVCCHHSKHTPPPHSCFCLPAVCDAAVPTICCSANIAGVPSVYGLYGAFLPVLVYAVFGSSKELAVGPVAVTSLLISSSLKEVVPGSVDITNPVGGTAGPA